MKERKAKKFINNKENMSTAINQLDLTYIYRSPHQMRVHDSMHVQYTQGTLHMLYVTCYLTG